MGKCHEESPHFLPIPSDMNPTLPSLAVGHLRVGLIGSYEPSKGEIMSLAYTERHELKSGFVLPTWSSFSSFFNQTQTLKSDLMVVYEQHVKEAWCCARNGFPQHCSLSGTRSCSCSSPATLNLLHHLMPVTLADGGYTLQSCIAPFPIHHGIIGRAGWGLRVAAGEITEWPQQHHRGPLGWSAQSR